MGEPPTLTKTTWWMQAKGLLFCTFVILSAIMGSVYVLTPLLPLMFINHRFWRRLIDRLIGFWMLMPCGLMEVLFGVRITASGCKIDHGEPALIIMNHRTCLDWLFFWNVLVRMDPWLFTSKKISLKEMVRYIPGAGWAMATNAYLFLTRRFEYDQAHIETMIDYYAHSGCAYQLLLFPEGTDKDGRATERSRQYALKKGLPHYSYVLHPRTTGFKVILGKMRQAGYVENIYDVTVGYADAIVQSEYELFFKGICPKNIHFHVERVDPRSLPEEDELLGAWLTERWKRKEAQLAKFYNSDDVKERNFRYEARNGFFELTTRSAVVIGLVVIFWMLMSAFLIYAFFCYPSQHFLAIITLIVFPGSEFLFGGFERVVIGAAKNTLISMRLKKAKL